MRGCADPDRLRHPPYARHLAAALGGDPDARFGQRLAHDLHVKAVRVHERGGVAHDADMPLPEHEIAAPERLVGGDRLAERGLLHVAVARRGDAGRVKPRLDQARAVDPFRRPAAPKIGRFEKALGDRDMVRLARAGLREMR